MSRIKSLKYHLLINNILILIIPVVILGVITLKVITQRTSDDIKYDNIIVSNYINNQVNNFIQNPIDMMVEIKNQLNEKEISDNNQINGMLNSILSIYPYFDRIQIVDNNGNVKYVAPFDNNYIGTSTSNEGFFTNTDKTGTPVYSNVFISPYTQKPTVTISIYSNGNIIAADLNLSKIVTIINGSHIDSVDHISILDANGIYLVDDNFENVSQRNRFQYFDEVKQNLLNNQQSMTVNNGEAVLLYSTKLKDTGWYSVISMKYSKVFHPVNQIKNILYIGLVIIIIISLALSLISISGIAKALKVLMNKMELISEGNYDNDLGYEGYEEFDKLTSYFNVMKNSIVERNADLIRTNDSLEETNAAFEEEISERTRIEEELREAKKEADNANKAKSEFLANMSHEIRTPINGIMGMTELALMENVDNITRDYLNLVMSSAQSLLLIINDILDYSKIEAGRIEIKNSPFNIKAVADEVLSMFELIASHKDIELKKYVQKSIPDLISGDAVRVKQILTNLIGNAIKFTSKGYIRLSIFVEAENNNSIKLKFMVKDTGIGVPKDKQHLLFNRFEQVDSSYTKQYQGTGLGLAISKSLVNLMGGEIWMQSEEGSGSTFYFTIIVNKIDELNI